MLNSSLICSLAQPATAQCLLIAGRLAEMADNVSHGDDPFQSLSLVDHPNAMRLGGEQLFHHFAEGGGGEEIKYRVAVLE